MIQLDEFIDEFKLSGRSGQYIENNVSYKDKFNLWQEKTSKKFKGFKIISVQKINNGIFVVWEK